MPNRLVKSDFFRRTPLALLLFASIIFITAASFRLQSYFFACKVNSVLSRMEKIQLDKTSKEEVLASLPELRPGIPWGFVLNRRPDESCAEDSCYGLRLQNWPDEMLGKLRKKLEYRHVWLFKTIYWLGHRWLTLGAFVQIRDGKVSRYEYALGVEDEEYPAGGIVGVQVLGADRAGFPGYFGSMSDYDEIGGFRIRIPNNMWTKTMYVAFTPEAQPEDVRNAFDVHLECAWNTEGCSADEQLLPLLWKQKIEPKRQK